MGGSVIDIIIPTYNGLDFLKECLASVEEHTSVPNQEWRIIIADDNSPDKKMKSFLKKTSHRVIYNQWERGFPSNCNHAVSLTDGEFICLLNSDTVATPGWLASLYMEMDDPLVAVVGSKLIFPDNKPDLGGKLQHAGVVRNAYGLPYHCFRGEDPFIPDANIRRELNAVTFACALIRREVWDLLDGLDRAFVGGQFEDVDFNWRVRKRGYKIVYQPLSVLYHWEHGAGEEFVFETEMRNRDLLLKKWPMIGSDEYLLISLSEELDKPEIQEAIAGFMHQVRAAAMQYAWAVPSVIPAKEHRDHCLRLAQIPYNDLPEPEKRWALAWAIKWVERWKAYENQRYNHNL